MTQVVQAFTRKRPADGPLLPASPSKHARVTPYDKPKAVLAFVAGVFAPAPPGLPLHNKASPARYPIQSTTPRASNTPRRTPMASQTVTVPPPPKSDDEALPTEPPRFHRKRSKDDAPPPPPSSTPPSISSTSQTSPNPTQNGSSSSHARRNSTSTPSTKGYTSSTASSSSPVRTTRPQSFHGSTHASNWGVPEPRKLDILNARSWKQLSYPSQQSRSSESSVASTSRVTLDSASSWRSTTESTTDRPSSATSATSTESFAETPQPRKKEDFSALPKSLFSPITPLPPAPVPSSLGLDSSPANSRIPSSSQPPLSYTSRTFKYTPKSDIHGPEWRYSVDLTREKSVKRSRSRPHIFQDQHNRDVKARHTNLWKTMQKYTPEWFARAKKRGYEGSEEDFTAWADYTMRAMQAVHGAMKGDDVRQGMDDHFAKIQPALFKSVKRVLEGPKPRAIFTPSIDLINKVYRAKDAAIDDILRPPKPSLPRSLSQEDEAFVNATLNKRGFVSKVAREQVGDADIRRLRPGEWLNDEVINFYGALVNARAEAGKAANVPRGKVLNAFYFSSFFWTKLSGNGYEKGKLERWTKKAKVDIFEKDVLVMPINHRQTHWTAGAVNFVKKRFESYDSMSIAKGDVTQLLRHYVAKEHEKKKGKPFNFDGWVDYHPEDIPQQSNGFDCGVFTCQFIESLSRGEDDFVFTQEDMPYIRRRMVWEIAHAKLRSD